MVWTSPSFNGSGNVTATAAIGSGVIVNADVNASATIALSKTALVAGTGITLATNTLNVDAAQTQVISVGALNAGSITSGFTSIDVGAGAITTTGTVTAGNLNVIGTTTTINSTNSTISDRLIELASGAGSCTADAGIVIERGSTGDNAIMAWDESQDRFIFGTTEATGASTGNLAITAGNIQANLIGNADTATALANARTIGGTSFDGTANTAVALAATATILATARTIGGVSFDGSANINLPGVNAAGNQNTSGTAATATESTNITAVANNSTDETVYPTFVDGATGTQGIETDTGFIYNSSSGMLTIAGELDAGSLDIAGNADIDGTLEADAITVDGTTLAEYIADTAGAMFSSNTETGITATYQDGDNTIDLVVGTLNQDTICWSKEDLCSL